MFQGKECMIKTDSYTYVKGMYDRYCPQKNQHHLLQCKMYTCISGFLIAVETPIMDIWIDDALFTESAGYPILH
jgi:hypothetical protein